MKALSLDPEHYVDILVVSEDESPRIICWIRKTEDLFLNPRSLSRIFVDGKLFYDIAIRMSPTKDIEKYRKFSPMWDTTRTLYQTILSFEEEAMILSHFISIWRI